MGSRRYHHLWSKNQELWVGPKIAVCGRTIDPLPENKAKELPLCPICDRKARTFVRKYTGRRS